MLALVAAVPEPAARMLPGMAVLAVIHRRGRPNPGWPRLAADQANVLKPLCRNTGLFALPRIEVHCLLAPSLAMRPARCHGLDCRQRKAFRDALPGGDIQNTM